MKIEKYFYLMGALLFAVSVADASSNAIHFQGRLTFSDGKPIYGKEVSIKFTLYPSATNGVSVWDSVGAQSVATNESGLFATDIGPISSDLFFTYETLYLSISVQDISGIYKTMKPRQKLSSVPYAIKSDYSNYAASATYIPANSVSTLQIEDGSITADDIAAGAIEAKHISPHAISQIKLSSNSVGVEQLQDHSVTAIKLSTDAIVVDSLNLVAGSVQRIHLVDGAVNGSKLELDSIESKHIVNKTVRGEDVADLTISSTNINLNTIDDANIKKDTVTRDKINQESFEKSGYGLVPKGALMMFLDACPVGYVEVPSLRGRYPIGADTLSSNPNVLDAPNKTMGSESHAHSIVHAHTLGLPVATVPDGKEQISSRNGLGDDDFVHPKLVKTIGAAGDAYVSIYGYDHSHEVVSQSVTASGISVVYPPSVTVLFCQKN